MNHNRKRREKQSMSLFAILVFPSHDAKTITPSRRSEEAEENDVFFAYPRKGGRNTCVFWRGTSAILFREEKILTGGREIGAAAAAFSPLSSFFFGLLAGTAALGRSRKTTPRWASSPAFNHL